MNILLHICCSNCALYPVKILRQERHNFTGFWFNPNIHPGEEYVLRLESLRKLAEEWEIDLKYTEEYRPQDFFSLFNMTENALIETSGSGGLNAPPFPERCRSCYRLRLEKTAAHAKENGFDAFSTTLLISPYQDFEKLIETGRELAEIYRVQFYEKDFRPFFRDAMALSKELGLYRQKYCGCVFSKEEKNKKKKSYKL